MSDEQEPRGEGKLTLPKPSKQADPNTESGLSGGEIAKRIIHGDGESIREALSQLTQADPAAIRHALYAVLGTHPAAELLRIATDPATRIELRVEILKDLIALDTKQAERLARASERMDGDDLGLGNQTHAINVGPNVLLIAGPGSLPPPAQTTVPIEAMATPVADDEDD